MALEAGGVSQPAGRPFPQGLGLVGIPSAVNESSSGSALRPVRGLLRGQQFWKGVVYVTGDSIVPRGSTLTIAAGTLVLFGPSSTLDIRGGRLEVQGTPGAPVWFTSDSPTPHAGDWRYLQIRDSCPNGESVLDCAIFEFALIGILIWNASPRLSRLFVRQNRWEGIYVEGHARPSIRGVM